MRTEIITLCDAATDYGGKLNILGTFDTVWVKQIPFNYPHCSVALRLRFNRVEEGDHRLKVNFMDEDGRLVMPSIDANLAVRFTGNEESTVANLVMNMQQIKFAKYGQYSIDIAINGRQEASLPLWVKAMPDSDAQGPAQG